MKSTLLARGASCLVALSFIALTSPVSAIDKPVATWEPASRANFHRGRSERITTVVIHTVEGSFQSCIATFRNPSSRVSAHYCVSKEGKIVQFVGDLDTAYHVRSANPHCIGIEHEGFLSRADMWTDAMYQASARLTRWLCDTYKIPIDRQHIVGHDEVPGNDHSDPGPYFDWAKYMRLVRGAGDGDGHLATNGSASSGSSANGSSTNGSRSGSGSSGAATPVGAQPVGETGSSSRPPSRGIAGALAGAEATSTPEGRPEPKHPQLANPSRGEHVEELQKLLAKFGHKIGADGIFGSETEKAVKAFQKEHGLAVDGIVGKDTWHALLAEPPKTTPAPAVTPASPPSRFPPPPGELGVETPR